MTTYYHYTTRDHFTSILADGLIALTESNVAEEGEHVGPDVVWLLGERLKKIPAMLKMVSPSVTPEQIASGAKLRMITETRGYYAYTPSMPMVSKAEVELQIELQKDQVVRADKFMKKHNADPIWLQILEESGGYKFIKQYVTTESIPVAKITQVHYLADAATGSLEKRYRPVTRLFQDHIKGV